MQKIQNYTGSTSSWPTAPSSWQWQPIQPNQLPPGCFAPRKSIPACSFAGFEPNVLWRAMKKVQNVDMNPLATSWTVPPDAHEGYEKRMKCLAAWQPIQANQLPAGCFAPRKKHPCLLHCRFWTQRATLCCDMPCSQQLAVRRRATSRPWSP
jgi:hypothetical protein